MPRAPSPYEGADAAAAGYASLTHVLALRPDLIQIDMSLIRNPPWSGFAVP